jgi:hypothetical protein
MQVSYENVIAPLANLEAEEFALVQSCVFPSLVSESKPVRDASSEAEKRIDAYNVKCRLFSIPGCCEVIGYSGNRFEGVPGAL